MKLSIRHRLIAYGELLPTVCQKLNAKDYSYYIKYTEGLSMKAISELEGIPIEQVQRSLNRIEKRFVLEAKYLSSLRTELKDLIRTNMRVLK